LDGHRRFSAVPRPLALDIHERQRIVRLLVKAVLVGNGTIVIRHSIPIPTRPSTDDHSPPTPTGGMSTSQCYLLRSGGHSAAFGHNNKQSGSLLKACS
jgi:hypothetical protein